MSPSRKKIADPDQSPGTGGSSRTFEAGLEAYERGDWKSARRLLQEAVEEDPRKQNRLQAAELAAALSRDRFALGLAGFLAAVLLGIFVLAVR